MKYGVHIDLLVSGADVTTHVEAVIDALAELEDCHEGLLDSTVGLDSGAGSVQVDMSLEAGRPGEALDLALSCLRSAIHSAGGATPNWGEESDPESVVVYRLDSDDFANVRQIYDLASH